jgi:hypothetical protein
MRTWRCQEFQNSSVRDQYTHIEDPKVAACKINTIVLLVFYCFTRVLQSEVWCQTFRVLIKG